jgi:dephospho-CoA kinase
MIKVGLSGNRYSGTDEICSIFRQYSIPVFEVDTILKFIINHDITVSSDIRSKLKSIHNGAGYIDPRLIRTKTEAEAVINSAKHELMSAYNKFSEKHRQSIYTIFHSSILFETGWQKEMNFNINVFCPKSTRIERCKQNLKIPISSAADLLRNEIDDLDKNKMANFVIHNYKGNKSHLDQVNKIDQYIIDEYLDRKHKNTIIETHF